MGQRSAVPPVSGFGGGHIPPQHRHSNSRGNHRTCWSCQGKIEVSAPCCLGMVEHVALMLGWRFIEPEGRMLCPDCRRTWVPRLPTM